MTTPFYRHAAESLSRAKAHEARLMDLAAQMLYQVEVRKKSVATANDETSRKMQQSARDIILRSHAEKEARVWSNADERAAAKINLAYQRFLETTNGVTGAAGLLVVAWVMNTRGSTSTPFDRMPFEFEEGE